MDTTVVQEPMAAMAGAWAARLRAVGEALDGVVGELDARRCDTTGALELLALFARVRKAASAGEALVARRADECAAHERTGHVSTAHLLAELGGTTVGRARDVVDAARRLEGCTQTAAAVRAGRVSVEQAAEIVRAAEVAPDAEAELLEVAGRASLGSLRSTARERRLAAEGDALGRYQRQRGARSVRHGIDDEGMGWGRWSLPPDDHAAVVQRLERQADREHRAHRSAGRYERHDQCLADALLTLCTHRDGDHAASRDTRAEVVVHVGLARLRGEDAPGEGICTVRGGGTVPVERVHELLGGDAFLKAVVHDGTDVHTVAHLGRRRPAEIDTALEARAVLADGDVICSAGGCDRTLGIEWDHEHPFAAGGATTYENLRPLCRVHHRRRTLGERARQVAVPGRAPP